MELGSDKDTVFIAMSKKSFYFYRHAVKYALESGYVPISPFASFDYFMTDVVERDVVREANNNLIKISDEMWVVGPVSDGVLAEIKLCRREDIPVRYFKIVDSKDMEEVEKGDVVLEDEVKEFKSDL